MWWETGCSASPDVESRYQTITLKTVLQENDQSANVVFPLTVDLSESLCCLERQFAFCLNSFDYILTKGAWMKPQAELVFLQRNLSCKILAVISVAVQSLKWFSATQDDCVGKQLVILGRYCAITINTSIMWRWRSMKYLIEGQKACDFSKLSWIVAKNNSVVPSTILFSSFHFRK